MYEIPTLWSSFQHFIMFFLNIPYLNLINLSKPADILMCLPAKLLQVQLSIQRVGLAGLKIKL